MEVKIRCGCGGKYTFPVEPVDGQVKGPVNCPSCGADWVEAVNFSVQTQLGNPSPSASPATALASRPQAAPAHAPAASLAAAPTASSGPPPPPPPPEVKKPVLRVQMPTAHAPAKPAAPAEEAAPAAAPAASPARAPLPDPAVVAALKKKGRAWGEPNVKMGVIGAIGSAIVASYVWYAFINWTQFNFSAIALLVGLVIGVTCRMMSGGYSQMLGTLCGFCAVFAIISAQYFAMSTAFHQEAVKEVRSDYRKKVDYAKRAVKMETEQQIRAFLAGEQSGEFSSVDPTEITKEEIEAFRDKLPDLKKYASGEITYESYAKNETDLHESGGFSLVILLVSMGLFGWIWLCVGSGLAYKLGTGEME